MGAPSGGRRSRRVGLEHFGLSRSIYSSDSRLFLLWEYILARLLLFPRETPKEDIKVFKLVAFQYMVIKNEQNLLRHEKDTNPFIKSLKKVFQAHFSET